MRRTASVLRIAAAVIPCVTGSASALEKTSLRAIDRAEDWNVSSSTTVRYYNYCTGWVWIWSGWSPGETVGTEFYLRCNGMFLNVSWALTFSGVPSGYGFTGTIAVRDAGCGMTRATQPYLPPATAGWHATAWGGPPVPDSFVVEITWGAPSGFTNSTGLASDRPLAGPTGPAACGSCFPTTRETRSRHYGIGGSYCPSGVAISDGLCDVELMLETRIKTPCDVWSSVEEESWGRIKSLYR